MYGITHLKIVAVFIITLGESFAEKFEDKKLKPWEILQLMFNLKPLPNIIKNREALKKEWLDIDEDEKRQLTELVAAELELPRNPTLEAKIEKAVPFGLDFLDWLDDFLVKDDDDSDDKI